MADLPGAAGQAAHDPAANPSAVNDTAVPSPLWRLALARALPALVAGLLTVFTGGHSPQFGLLLFGGWAILDALAGFALLARAGLVDAGTRRLLLIRAAVVLVGGLVAVVTSSAGAVALVVVIGLTALAAGALDLVAGVLRRGGLEVARDLIIAGAAAALLGVVTLVIPPGLEQPFPGAEGHPGVLTSGTIVTGLFGAWGVVTGVLWAIAGVGLRWPARGARPRTADGGVR
jgi:uncharacterized membrane protein HdeD (DUF308 family)